MSIHSLGTTPWRLLSRLHPLTTALVPVIPVKQLRLGCLAPETLGPGRETNNTTARAVPVALAPLVLASALALAGARAVTTVSLVIVPIITIPTSGPVIIIPVIPILVTILAVIVVVVPAVTVPASPIIGLRFPSRPVIFRHLSRIAALALAFD